MTSEGTKMTDKENCDLSSFTSLLEEVGVGSSESRFEGTTSFREKKEVIGYNSLYQYLSENIYYCHLQTDGTEEKTILIQPKKDYVQLHLCLSGNCFYRYPATDDILFETEAHFHNIFYRCGNCLEFTVKKGDQLNLILVNVHISFFKKYFSVTDQIGSGFLNAISGCQDCRLCTNNLPINANLEHTIQSLINMQENSDFKKNWIEAKVIELLTLQLQCLIDQQKNLNPLSKDEIEKMSKAKDIVLQHLNEPLTLKELSKEVGTNEFHLKKHFKALFGKTVFAYLLDYKMELAKSQIVETDKSIAQIGMDLGFKYPTHFTAAFKKHFGFLPNHLRRN